MKILRLIAHLDGGSLSITTDSGVYFLDERLHSDTEGELYEGYPLNTKDNFIKDSGNLKKALREAALIFKRDRDNPYDNVMVARLLQDFDKYNI